jgi:glycosyltransferase involved in cell wall biosynthesis
MEVLYVYGDFRSGGLEIDIRNLANGLLERGHRSGLATASVDSDPAGSIEGLAPGVEVRPLRPRCGTLGRRVGLASGVGRVIRDGAWRVVHVFSALPSYAHFAAMAAGRAAGAAVVWTPMLHPSRATTWDHGVARHALRSFDTVVPHAARFAHAVVAATDDEAERFSRLRCGRVEIIPPAVEDAPLLAEDAAAGFRDRYGLGSGGLVLMVAARSERRKGLSFGIAAFRALQRLVPGVSLAIVGLPAAEFPGAAEGVHALGRIPLDGLTGAYRAADVVLVPSRYEAFSRVVIEAWQQATPVVVSGGVGLARTVSATQASDWPRTGSPVVPYGDVDAAAGSLRAILADPAAAARAGAAGRALVERAYTVPRVVDDSLALYRELAR